MCLPPTLSVRVFPHHSESANCCMLRVLRVLAFGPCCDEALKGLVELFVVPGFLVVFRVHVMHAALVGKRCTGSGAGQW
jgi:hypothetical protein